MLLDPVSKIILLGLLVTDFLFIESKARKAQGGDILGCSIILHASVPRPTWKRGYILSYFYVTATFNRYVKIT